MFLLGHASVFNGRCSDRLLFSGNKKHNNTNGDSCSIVTTFNESKKQVRDVIIISVVRDQTTKSLFAGFYCSGFGSCIITTSTTTTTILNYTFRCARIDAFKKNSSQITQRVCNKFVIPLTTRQSPL